MDEATIEDLRARAASARARIQQVSAARAAAEEERALPREVARLEQEARDSEALLNAEAEHGADKIATVETDMGLIILRRPDSLRYKKFQDLDKAKTLDVEKLVRPCVLHPDKNTFDIIATELPATIVRCGAAVARLAGNRSKELSEK